MFTGIIQELGKVVQIRKSRAGRRLVVASKRKAGKGDSIAVNGVCLTAVSNGGLTFDVVPETLARTTLGGLRKGSRVNLEPSLRAGDPIGGHFVQGHVDGTGEVRKFSRGKDRILHVDVDPQVSRFMVPKGSVTIEGVSLTLVDVDRDSFSVALIPFTLKHTTLGRLMLGDRVNIETDILGKYVLSKRAGVDKDLLDRAGFR